MTETDESEPSNYFEWLPNELFGNIIAQFTPILEFRDYQSMIEAYPSLKDKLSQEITHLDFFNGRDPVDSTGRVAELPNTRAPFSWDELHRQFPKLQEYRCHVNKLSSLEPAENDHILDPRARYLLVVGRGGGKRIEQDGIEFLKKAIELRIERYGSEFTLIFAPSHRRMIEDGHKGSEFGFSFHNGTLHLEGTYIDYVDREKYALFDELPTLLEQIFTAFAPVIRVIGVDEAHFLRMIFANTQFRSLIPQVTIVYLNYPRYEPVRKEFSLVDSLEFPGLFEQITELRFSPRIDRQRFLLRSEVAEEFICDLRSHNRMIWSNITVMELPIPLAEKEFIQELFPRVTKFQFQEHLELDYHFEQYERVRAKIELLET